VVTYIIQQLVEDPANLKLLQNVDWYIMPVVNPDGKGSFPWNKNIK
jgi:murein tripeptide amidase MpaA